MSATCVDVVIGVEVTFQVHRVHLSLPRTLHHDASCYSVCLSTEIWFQTPLDDLRESKEHPHHENQDGHLEALQLSQSSCSSRYSSWDLCPKKNKICLSPLTKLSLYSCPASGLTRTGFGCGLRSTRRTLVRQNRSAPGAVTTYLPMDALTSLLSRMFKSIFPIRNDSLPTPHLGPPQTYKPTLTQGFIYTTSHPPLSTATHFPTLLLHSTNSPPHPNPDCRASRDQTKTIHPHLPNPQTPTTTEDHQPSKPPSAPHHNSKKEFLCGAIG